MGVGKDTRAQGWSSSVIVCGTEGSQGDPRLQTSRSALCTPESIHPRNGSDRPPAEGKRPPSLPLVPPWG